MTYVDHFFQFLSQSEHTQDYDYYGLAQHIRAYVRDVYDAGDVTNQESSKQIREEHCLTITRRKDRGIASVKLKQMRPIECLQDVEIFGMYYHGVEELFLAATVSVVGVRSEHRAPRMVLRSLRHRSDETIKQSMRWLVAVLLTDSSP